MRKVGVIGLGHVGSTVAYTLVTKGIADELVLIDTNEAKSQELLKAFTTERQGWPELKAVQSKNVYSTHHGLPREVYDVAVYLHKAFNE